MSGKHGPTRQSLTAQTRFRKVPKVTTLDPPSLVTPARLFLPIPGVLVKRFPQGELELLRLFNKQNGKETCDSQRGL